MFVSQLNSRGFTMPISESAPKPTARHNMTIAVNMLDVPADLRKFCRANGIVMGMDAFMRHTFIGSKALIEELIVKHLAPTSVSKQQDLLRSMIEA